MLNIVSQEAEGDDSYPGLSIEPELDDGYVSPESDIGLPLSEEEEIHPRPAKKARKQHLESSHGVADDEALALAMLQRSR